MAKNQFPREISFHIDFTSEGERYQGRFVAKRPNIMEQVEIEGEKSRILKGHYYDPDNPGCGIPPTYAVMADTMAFLNVAIIEGPEWWTDGEVYDIDLVANIYDEAQEVDPFRGKIKKKPEIQGVGIEPVGPDGGDSDKQHNDSVKDDGFEEMVSTEV